MAIVLSNNGYKAIAIPVIFFYGYSLVINSRNIFNSTLIFIFLINSFLIISQVLGIDEVFYKFQFYSHNPTNIFIRYISGESGIPPDFQYRVSGIFPSTIFLSLFQILIFGIWISSNEKINSAIKFFVGFIFALIGSTVSLILFIYSFFYIGRVINKYIFQLGFIMGLFFLITFCPEIFDLNYTFEEKLMRIDTRFFDPSGNSSLTDNLPTFIFFVVVMIITLLVIRIYIKRIEFLSISSFILMCISPLIVHPLFTDIRYWLVLGAASGLLLQDYLGLNKISRNLQ